MKRIVVWILGGLCTLVYAQSTELYRDPAAPVEERVEDLLSRMTLAEKIALIGGTGTTTRANERLGIPELRMTDGTAGVQLDRAPSMAFPAPIALAATWNPDLVRRAGRGMGREVKGHGRHVLLAPCVNIARMPMSGRNFEAYGEDPFLAARMAVAAVQGIQEEGVAATVKHFAANNQESERMFVDVAVSRRALQEIYFPAFKAAVREAGAGCVMSSYNKVNGRFASENEYLLKEILRDEWGFRGVIMSDWGATHSAIPTARGELDIEMPTGVFMNMDSLQAPIADGRVPLAAIEQKARHILTLIFKLGLFDHPPLARNPTLINTPENRQIAYEAALAGMVLLKNERNILPLNPKRVKTIAVIGPNARVARTGGGGSSEVNDLTPVTLLDGLKSRLPEVHFEFAQGAILDNTTEIDPIAAKNLFTDRSGKQQGLNAEYFNNIDLVGRPILQRIDREIHFTWDENGPGSGVARDHYSVRWSGYIKMDATAEYILAIVGDDGMRLWLDDQLLLDAWYPHGAMKRAAAVRLQKGRYYQVRFELYEKAGGAVATLGWDIAREALYREAAATARKADCVILAVGTTSALETEGRDRPDLVLPNGQDQLIERVAAVNKNVIVVLTAGSPVLMDRWIGQVPGLLDAWFPGTEGGHAIVDILVGNANPSGKLPMTFPHRWEECSAYRTYNRFKERSYYADDIYVGYRHFDKYHLTPLFPFGFGLSYTRFAYSDLHVTREGDHFTVTFAIRNTGTTRGEETAQLYVGAGQSSMDKPEKELKGFAKVRLDPGEEKQVKLLLTREAFAWYSEQFNAWQVDPGLYRISIGASSRDFRLEAELNLE